MVTGNKVLGKKLQLTYRGQKKVTGLVGKKFTINL